MTLKKTLAFLLLWTASLGSLFAHAPQQKATSLNNRNTQKTIVINSLEELLEHIDNNTKLIIKERILDISSTNFEKYEGIIPDRLKRNVVLTELGLSIRNMTNISLVGERSTKVFSTNHFDNILTFTNCSQITLENLVIVHQMAEVSCEGSVLELYKCDHVQINNCNLNGSGTVGLYANASTNVYVNNTYLENNSESAVVLSNSSTVYLTDCTIKNNNIPNDLVDVANNSLLTFTNCTFSNNTVEYGRFFQIQENDMSTVKCVGCKMINNLEKSNFSPSFIFSQSDFVLDRYSLSSPKVKRNTKEDCSNVSAGDRKRLEASGMSNTAVNDYCFFVTNEKPSVFVTTALPTDAKGKQKIELIINLLKWEDQKNKSQMYRMYDFYTFPLQSYWNKTNVTPTQLEQVYTNSWNVLLASQNHLTKIAQNTENTFTVELIYLYYSKKINKPQKVTTTLKVLFEKGKIKSVKPA